MLQKINSLVVSLSSDNALNIKGFHPDLLLPLIRVLDCRLIISVPDEHFGLITKYLSSLWDDDAVVFVSDYNSAVLAPVGFLSSEKFFFQRAKECLSGGVNNIKTIVCSSGGFVLPVVGTGGRQQLDFNDRVSFGDCTGFLIAEGYVLVDFVGAPGEYATRGGDCRCISLFLCLSLQNSFFRCCSICVAF